MFWFENPRTDPALQDLHSSNYRVCMPSVSRLFTSLSVQGLRKYSTTRHEDFFPSLFYKEALDRGWLISLSVRRQFLTDKLFTKVTADRENKLHHLLLEQRTCHYNLRKQRRFKPVSKTNRSKSSFIIHNSQKLYN